MTLAGIPKEVFQLLCTRTHADSQRRVNRFMEFYSSPEAGCRLRRASLCLQLTAHMVNITAKKDCAGPSSEPIMVMLGKGRAQKAASGDFARVVKNMHMDSELNITEAVFNLFITSLHIIIRFQMYKEYPYRLWKLCSEWNSTGFVSAIEDFLNEESGRLDAGYSLPLQQEALRKGSYADALSFMLSEPSQARPFSRFTVYGMRMVRDR